MPTVISWSGIANAPNPILSLEVTVILWKKNRKKQARLHFHLDYVIRTRLQKEWIWTVPDSWDFSEGINASLIFISTWLHCLSFTSLRAFETPNKQCLEETGEFKLLYEKEIWNWPCLESCWLLWKTDCGVLSSIQICCCLCLVSNCFGS